MTVFNGLAYMWSACKKQTRLLYSYIIIYKVTETACTCISVAETSARR